MRVRIVVIYGAKIMNDSFKSNQNALTQAELASQLKLINIAEIEILQAVLLVINTQYFKEKQYLEPALVCALLLNHPQIPSLYATSPRGYLKQQKKYAKGYKENIQQKQSYLSTYQVKVRKVIRQVVSQVNLEGSEHSFSANATAAKNQANARNVKSWDNANHSTLDE